LNLTSCSFDSAILYCRTWCSYDSISTWASCVAHMT